MHVRVETAQGGAEIGDDLDADGRAAASGLEDVRARERDGAANPVAVPVAVAAQQHPREHGQARRLCHPGERQLVHAQCRPRHTGPRVGDADEVEHGLQRAVLPGATVTAIDHHVHRQGAGATEAPGTGYEAGSLAAGDQLQRLRAAAAHLR